MKIYKEFEEAKNGTLIPVFLSGKTMESRYNPQRDAQALCDTITGEEKFFLVLGVGSGLFLELLSQKYPDAKIIAFELFEEDLAFLQTNERIKELSKNPLISFAHLQNFEELLIQNYLPAKYGNLKIVEQRAWVNENQNQIEKINSTLQKTLGIISADYSVQAHFGKIWTSNIMNNSLLAQKHHLYSFENKADILKKTAVIVAAGPTLDKTLSLLCDNNTRENYFIISTDTAAQTLYKHVITPEVIVSIDGQSVSYNHFINQKKSDSTNQSGNPGQGGTSPVFAFDLCSNSSAERYVCEKDSKVFFFCSGHPLSSAINASNGYALPVIFSGAGTVTITAVDLAVQSGFEKLLILGADFSYSKGKAYSSGTYLDTLYNKDSSKLSKAEGTFSKLMFRTELKSLSQDVKTTEILEAYKFSLEKYLTEKNITFSKEKDIYKLECPPLTASSSDSQGIFTRAPAFSLKNFFNKLTASSPEENEMLLLPYLAWLRNNQQYQKLSYNELLKLSLDSIVSYNI